MSLRALLLLMFSASLAQAATIRAVTERQMVLDADAIILGAVVGVESHVDGAGRVVTDAAVQVYRNAKGALEGKTVVIRAPGGRIGSVTAHVSGAAALATGDMVVGLLEQRGEVYLPLGMAFGIYQVEVDASGTSTVYREIDGQRLLGAGGTRVRPAGRAQTLDELWKRLVAHVASPPSTDAPEKPQQGVLSK